MALSVDHISHAFGDARIVNDVSFHVEAGSIACLFGPSGCGKTTVLRIIAGLEALQRGRIELGGLVLAGDGRDRKPEHRSVGFVFQDYVLFPHMTVAENVAFGVKGQSHEKRRTQEQIDALGLGEFVKRYPHELSGGQQQRVAIARALTRNPRALLLDEPFASIDATLRRALRSNLRRILKEQNVATVLVTHDPEEALALGDTIMLMRDGAVVEQGAPQALFERPKTADGAALFPGSQRLTGEIRHGALHTEAGAFPCPKLPDGSGVAILRDGALTAVADPEGAFEVEDCRFAGPGYRLSLIGRRDRVRLEAPSPAAFDRGAAIALVADLSQTFIFATL